MDDEQMQREIAEAQKVIEVGVVGMDEINFVYSVLLRVNQTLKTRLNIEEKPLAKVIPLY